MEADFLRDYGIDLMERLDDMSWRRFVTLYRNLSPYGAAAARADELRKEAEKESDPESDRAAAAAFFSDVISTRKGRGE